VNRKRTIFAPKSNIKRRDNLEYNKLMKEIEKIEMGVKINEIKKWTETNRCERKADCVY
jgi:hypothetical protein